MTNRSTRANANPIDRFSPEAFRAAVDGSETIAEAIEKITGCDMRPTGNNYRVFQRRCREDGIDTAKFSRRRIGRRSYQAPLVPLEQVAIVGSCYSRGALKRRLLRDGLLENRCAICGLGPEWNGKPMVMVLDHINGINNDHRLSNLRLVCHNCDSQLDTYKRRNGRKAS